MKLYHHARLRCYESAFEEAWISRLTVEVYAWPPTEVAEVWIIRLPSYTMEPDPRRIDRPLAWMQRAIVIDLREGKCSIELFPAALPA